MFNKEEFDKVFGSYKTSYMAETLGISPAGYINKKKGISEFKCSEISILKDIGKLTSHQVDKMFLQ